jgi:hypothetical protein
MTVYRYRARIPRAVVVYNSIKKEIEKLKPETRHGEEDND